MQEFTIGPETERLEHRAFRAEDAAALYALNGSPQVMRYTGEPVMASLEEAKRAIENYPDFDTFGFGRWACILKRNQEVIGFCGMKYLPDLKAVDVGYRFLPEHWGQGLATEACRACLQFGFQTLKLPSIIALVLPKNAASIRVAEKAGMQLDGTFHYDGMETLRFIQTRGCQ